MEKNMSAKVSSEGFTSSNIVVEGHSVIPLININA